MVKHLKWLAITFGFLIALFPLVIGSPILLPILLGALWYFTKKKPNERIKKYAKNGAIISTIGLGLFVLASCSETDEAAIEPDIEEIAQADEESDISDEELAEEKEAEEERQRKKEEQERRDEEERLEQERLEKEEEERQREKELAEANPNKTGETEARSKPIEVPDGKEDVIVNNNIPFFSDEDITSTDVYHRNGSLDSLGRETAANALVGVDIMPAEERESISHIEPSGWNQARYANIGSGGWLFNRSHLIGHQMTGNDDRENLMTGTRWFNMRMLEYENWVANYVETTENHVRYRVTPVFEGDNLVASGAYMEAFSIEDNGEEVMFNVYVPNVQPGVEINYADGSSVGPAGPAEEGEISSYPGGGSSSSNNKEKATTSTETKPDTSNPYVDENGNGLIKGSNSGIYHVPGSSYYDRTTNPAEMFKSVEEAEAAGYRAPKR